MNDIDRKIATGAAWMVSFKLVDRALGVVSTIVLARLLLPADFGLVAMATMLIGALQLLASFSFDVPLIQNQNAGRDQFDTAWTLNVVFAVLCGLILALLAHPAAGFYREPRLEAVIYLLAIGYAIQGSSNIGPVVFRREMKFHLEFKFLLGKRLASVLVTIPAAIWLRSYWALVIGQLFGSIVSVLLSYWVSEYRPRLSLRSRVELFHSSKWLVLNNIMYFANGKAADFFIGRFSGASTLGVYAIASEISTLPSTELVAPINRAAFPGYSRAASHIKQLRSSFLNVIGMIALIAVPAGVGIVSLADLFVPVILGEHWRDAIPVIQVLAIYGVIQALQTNISYVYMALGNLRLIVIVAATQLAILLALLVPALQHFGAVGAAYAFLASALVVVPLNQFLVARCLGLNGFDFLSKLLRPFTASCAMGVGVSLIKAAVPSHQPSLITILGLLLCMFAGMVLYALALYLLWSRASRPAGAERVCFSKMQEYLHRAGLHIRIVKTES